MAYGFLDWVAGFSEKSDLCSSCSVYTLFRDVFIRKPLCGFNLCVKIHWADVSPIRCNWPSIFTMVAHEWRAVRSWKNRLWKFVTPSMLYINLISIPARQHDGCWTLCRTRCTFMVTRVCESPYANLNRTRSKYAITDHHGESTDYCHKTHEMCIVLYPIHMSYTYTWHTYKHVYVIARARGDICRVFRTKSVCEWREKLECD